MSQSLKEQVQFLLDDYDNIQLLKYYEENNLNQNLIRDIISVIQNIVNQLVPEPTEELLKPKPETIKYYGKTYLQSDFDKALKSLKVVKED